MGEYQRYVKDHKKGFPVAQNLSDNILCLPIFAEMRDYELDWVIDRIMKYSEG